MNEPQQAEEFFKLWVDACGQRHKILLSDWFNAPAFTAHVLNEPNAIIEDIARSLKLECYCGYYSIDAILFKKTDDRVPGIPEGTTWVRRIRVAFEHENYFDSGLFQELSHLLITDCDLRVLVSYPDNEGDLNYQKEYLRSIIAGIDRSDQIEKSGAFLFIVGWHDDVKKTIEWWGHVYERTQWRKL
jgi:hypothetical protein